MNYYILVEGITEKHIYKSWIPQVNPKLSPVDFLSQIKSNNYIVYSGGGYPGYFDMIGDAIETVNSNLQIDKLVIGVDSEDWTKDDKYEEIDLVVKSNSCRCQVDIVIQHVCIETWGLGNVKIGPRNPKSHKVRYYKNIYDVLSNDPEELPSLPQENLNRAQFAFAYLKALFSDKNKQLTHSKTNPKTMMHPKYYQEVKHRCMQTGHITSFNDFVKAFQ